MWPSSHLYGTEEVIHEDRLVWVQQGEHVTHFYVSLMQARPQNLHRVQVCCKCENSHSVIVVLILTPNININCSHTYYQSLVLSCGACIYHGHVVLHISSCYDSCM